MKLTPAISLFLKMTKMVIRIMANLHITVMKEVCSGLSAGELVKLRETGHHDSSRVFKAEAGLQPKGLR